MIKITLLIFINYYCLEAITEIKKPFLLKYTVYYLDKENFISSLNQTFILIDSLKSKQITVDSIVMEIYEDSVDQSSSRRGHIFFNNQLEKFQNQILIKTKYYGDCCKMFDSINVLNNRLIVYIYTR